MVSCLRDEIDGMWRESRTDHGAYQAWRLTPTVRSIPVLQAVFDMKMVYRTSHVCRLCCVSTGAPERDGTV